MVQLMNHVKPSDFDLETRFVGSCLRNYEKERVAMNIIIICKANGDGWLTFDFEEYKKYCAPRTEFNGEEAVLEALMREDRVLTKVGKTYMVNDNFVRKLAVYLK